MTKVTLRRQVKNRNFNSQEQPVKTTMTQLLTLDPDIDSLSEYLDFQPGEDLFFDELIAQYGIHLEKLTESEKLFLTVLLSQSLCLDAHGKVGNTIIPLSQKCLANFGKSDLLGLMSALADQIRCGHYAEH
jgi:hypothetical protein